jgi:hypothetical protein
MKHGSSNFYSNFSMAELVKRNSSWPSLESLGGEVGGGGGGVCFSRVGSHGSGSGLSRFHKTGSFAFHLRPGGLVKTDEEKFLSSLKADLQDEIVKSGARITASGDLETPGCYAEYGEEGIQGRIEVSGRLAGGSYYSLTATLSETSTSEKPPLPPLIERQKGRQPMGTYYVVPFPPDDPRASTEDLLAVGQKIMKQSIENIRQRLLADHSRKDSLLQDLEYAEVYVWTPMPPEIKQRWKEAMGEEFEAPAECEQFAKVYFLNEVALRMYREAGEDFEVLKTISADEVSKIPGPSLSGPYMAASEPER